MREAHHPYRIRLFLYSFPFQGEGSGMWPKVTFTTNLERYRIKESTVYKGRVSVFCDNGDPAAFTFYFKFENGQLHVGMHPKRLKPVKQCPA